VVLSRPELPERPSGGARPAAELLFAVSANCAFTNVYGSFKWGDSIMNLNNPYAIFIAVPPA
jgi:hypothetical protein